MYRGDLMSVMLPTLFLIGTIAWLSRKTRGGAGSGIFSIGKHKVGNGELIASSSHKFNTPYLFSF